jgi:hypothetical protein
VPSRDIQIPLFLWIATAIIVHLLGGGSTHQVAVVLEEKAALRGFAAHIQREVQADLRPIPIVMLESDTVEPPKPVEPEEATTPDETKEKIRPDDASTKKTEKTKTDKERKKIERKEKPKPEAEPKKLVEPPKVEPPKQEQPLDLLAKKPEVQPPQELQMEPQKRISVRQHVEDKNQQDNPDAKFLGEHANRVQEESQAKITSTDQDHPNPTPGSSPPDRATTKEPGNGDETRVASAFGDQDEGSALAPPPPEVEPRVKPVPDQPPSPQTGAAEESAARQSNHPHSAQEGQKPQIEDPGAKTSPNLVAGDQGDYSMGGPAPARPKRKRLPPVKSTQPSDWYGLGSGMTTASGIQLNLSHSDAVAVVGQNQLQADRRMDQLRRRSKRAGSWKLAGFERYRSAIENYVPSVKPGNTTALNAARSPFATYLNDIHNRIHPIFADDFLGSLDRLPRSDPMNRPDLKTEVEIVVSQLDGSLVRRGLTKSSGILQFDVSALASVDRAAPFGTPPAAIVSPDGNVYLHWEFYRNPDFACSTYFAHPFILKAAPKPTSPEPAPTEPGPREPLGPRILPTFGQLPNRQQTRSIQL